MFYALSFTRGGPLQYPKGYDTTSSASSLVEEANRLYVGLLIMLIFSEALALYGLIIALILSQHSFVRGN
jgi:F0F1-type ATP synthase membrane subunit c/vacuolar-type H+-ATPase subunit K